MVAYTGIQGQNILIVSSDPANPTEGQIWYNSTSNLLKGYANVVTNAWASGGNLGTARWGMMGGGTQTAGLAATGGIDTGPSTATEEYNGTSWTAGNPVNTGVVYTSGAGSQTAAIKMAGYPGPSGPTGTGATELYNGTSWTTSPATLNVIGYAGTCFGIQTAAIFTARDSGSGPTTNTESWNGTIWTAVNVLNTARSAAGSSGTQPAGLIFGGDQYPSPRTSASTESWNGTSWTTVNSLNTARNSISGCGTQTLALAFGGFAPSVTGATELWNGTSWTSNPSGLATAKGYRGNAGTQASALAFGGNPFPVNATEEWTGTAVAVRTITTS